MANSKKALDENGVLYLWGKVKTYVATAIANIKLPSKTSDLTNDSGFITAKDVPEGAAASSTVPKMDGTAAAGTETAFARGDHVHPSDTTKVDKVEGKGLSANDYTNEEKAKLGGVEANANNYTLPDASALEYKGSKDTYADLPTTGNKKGDVWNIVNADAAHGVNAGDNVAWNGTTWDVLAGTVDLSAYMLASDLVAITNTELDDICK